MSGGRLGLALKRGRFGWSEKERRNGSFRCSLSVRETIAAWLRLPPLLPSPDAPLFTGARGVPT